MIRGHQVFMNVSDAKILRFYSTFTNPFLAPIQRTKVL